MKASTLSIPNAEPNVTPMIDVLLVLLIVFMMVAVQMHHSIDVQLPEPRVGPSATAPAIVLEVLPGPTYRLNQRPIAKPNLLAELTATYRGRPDKTLQVAGAAVAQFPRLLETHREARAESSLRDTIRAGCSFGSQAGPRDVAGRRPRSSG